MRQLLERTIILFLLKHSNLSIPAVTLKHGNNADWLKALQLLRGMRITAPLLLSKFAQIGALISKEEVKSYMSELDNGTIPVDEKESQTILKVMVEDLWKQEKKSILLDQVDEARRLIIDDKEQDAIAKLKQLKFEGKEFKTTMQLMMDGMDGTVGFQTGISSFDDLTGGFLTGNVMSVTGDTGVMKTTFVLWLILNILKQNKDFTAVFFEKEMQPTDLARRISNRFTQRSTKELLKDIMLGNSRHLKTELREKVSDQDEELINRLKIIPNTEFHTLTDLHAIIDSSGCNVWALDYTTQLAVGRSDFNVAVMEFANGAKDLVASTATFGILINQMKKISDMRRDKRPYEDDAEWSGAIKQISAYHLGLFYPAKYYSNGSKYGDYNLDTQWYYVNILKNRHEASNVPVPLIAYPSVGEFLTPDPLKEKEMMGWWYGYDRGVK